MKLKPQPPVRRGGSRRRRAGSFGSRPRGRGAKRPGPSLRRRLAGRLPSIGRAIAGMGAIATAALLAALLNGPWLRISEVAWGGEHYTAATDLEQLLDRQRGTSILALDTRALRERLERMPSVAEANVSASLTGRLEATVIERQVAFVWETSSGRFLGAADGTIFARAARDDEPAVALEAVPHVTDGRFAARLVTVGDAIPAELLRIATRLAGIDPAALGSSAARLGVRLDDAYGFRLVSTEPAWEAAFGVYGLDPRETPAEADARLERQVTAVRTLFASRPEAEIGWVDVRNPGKVYFRAKG